VVERDDDMRVVYCVELYDYSLEVAIRVWPIEPTRKKNAGRARIVSPQARSGPTHISLQPAHTSPQPA